MKIQRIDTQRDDVEHALGALRESLSPRGEVVSEAGRARTVKVFGQPLSPQEVVEQICGDVRRQGLDALLRYTLQLDDASLDASTIRVSPSELEEAHETADPQFLATIRAIRENILEFQQEILCRDVEVVRPHGGFLRQRYAAFERVGICVPGGAAAYPSTVLMTAIPAQAAGVPQLAVVAPPTQFGAYNTDLLATCHELGIAEVYRVGGAQGVAALAYGVDGIAKVDKIVGPGNLFVALAKKLVYGDVDIDSIAGPSEVVVIADETARPEFVAADLLAQAEHAPGASILVTWDRSLLESVDVELSEQVTRLGRSELTVESMEHFGALILVRDAEEAAQVANRIAPEHLHICAESAEALLLKIPNAGAVFLGNYTPVALGDYVAGPSHVLPTGGTARFLSGLSANDFRKSGSVIHYTMDGLKAAARDVRIMTDKEGLSAHRASLDIRIDEG